MAVSRNDLLQWIMKQPEEAVIGIDEGGMALESTFNGAYFEIGGMPVEEDEE